MDATVHDVRSRRCLDFEEGEDPTTSDVHGEMIIQKDPEHLSVDIDMMEGIHSNMSEELIPRVGMEFKTKEAAFQFYNAYALVVGFSVRRSTCHRVKEILVDRLFVCSCEGKRVKDKRDNVYVSHRPETRFGCKAMLKISCRYTSTYRVDKFIAEHIHNLASPRKTHLYRSHRKITMPQAFQVDMADDSGIAPRNTYEFMARQAGGRESLGFSKVDVKNYLRSRRSLEMASGDAGGVLEYLQRMKEDDPTFFYAIKVDEDDLITNIFWADARMMADYEAFGDVVCFDTTYRKHKDGRPIALFVGVNHHKQFTIFGVALLYDETTDTFIWLFDTFSRAMGGKLPQTMLTDQDAAMSKALASQWPQTYHRLFILHIFQNAAIHLNDVFKKHKDFARDFSNCVYDYEHETDFLEAWSEMLDKYQLQDNEWMKRMFRIKEKWALVYGRDTFCADMSTTQRSESMNSLIKKYVSYTYDLKRFFVHFHWLLNDRRYDEMLADFKASQSKVVLPVSIALLKHVASVYTPEVYLMFQESFSTGHDCHIEVYSEMIGEHVKYKVTHPRKNRSYVVSYDDTQKSVSCTCRRFEFAGLLCSHTLKVFSFREISEIPSKYILKRWTKAAKRGSIRDTSESRDVDKDLKTTMGAQYKDLHRVFTHLSTRAFEVEDGYVRVKEGLLNMLKELNLSSTKKPQKLTMQHKDITENDAAKIQDMPTNLIGVMETTRGLKLKPKSRSRSSQRPKNALEKAVKRRKTHKHSTPPSSDLLCFVDNQVNQQICSSNIGLETRNLQYDGSTSQQPGVEYYQFNQQLQPSFMELLTSIEVPKDIHGHLQEPKDHE